MGRMELRLHLGVELFRVSVAGAIGFCGLVSVVILKIELILELAQGKRLCDLIIVN